MALLGIKDFGGASINGSIYIIPEGCTYLRATLTGAGGAGDFGRNSMGGGGGGRGATGEKIVWGDLGGRTIIITTGIGGHAPTELSFGNVGTHTILEFDNGWQLIAGGGQRAEGDYAGRGGNNAKSGVRPPYVIKHSEHNIGSETGQNGTLLRGGSGAGNGDTGGGGNGGNPGQPGTEGGPGYVNIQFFS